MIVAIRMEFYVEKGIGNLKGKVKSVIADGMYNGFC